MMMSRSLIQRGSSQQVLSLYDHPIGQFRTVSVIGRGFQGVVYRAYDPITNSEVAIKAVPRPTSSFESLELVQREVSLLRQMDHPFIVPFFDLRHNETDTFFVMELVDGGSFGKYLHEHGPLPEEDCRHFFYEIVAVLDYLHTTRHVIHRDLKPENMLLDGNRDLRLIDFGFAKAWTESSPLLTTSCGSPHYAAPEVISGNFYSTGADIWSAGVILYAMAAGALPFVGPDVESVLQAVVTDKPVLPEGLSADLTDLLARTLVKDPAARITLEDVKRHPWFAGYTDWTSFPHAFDQLRISDVAELDARVVARLRSLGIDSAGLLQEVRDKRMNPRTLAYKMIRRIQITEDLAGHPNNGCRPSILSLSGAIPTREIPPLNVFHSGRLNSRTLIVRPKPVMCKVARALSRPVMRSPEKAASLLD